MATLTEKRVDWLNTLDKDALYNGLSYKGPRGGNNAMRIPGWSVSPTAGWCRAAHLAGFKSLPFWHGSAPTPSRAFPDKIVDMMYDSEL